MGGTVEAWVPESDSYASIKPLRATSRMLLGREMSEATVEVGLREAAGVRAEDRIVVQPDGPTYMVLGLQRLPGARGATALCREVVP